MRRLLFLTLASMCEFDLGETLGKALGERRQLSKAELESVRGMTKPLGTFTPPLDGYPEKYLKTYADFSSFSEEEFCKDLLAFWEDHMPPEMQELHYFPLRFAYEYCLIKASIEKKTYPPELVCPGREARCLDWIIGLYEDQRDHIWREIFWYISFNKTWSASKKEREGASQGLFDHLIEKKLGGQDPISESWIDEELNKEYWDRYFPELFNSDLAKYCTNLSVGTYYPDTKWSLLETRCNEHWSYYMSEEEPHHLPGADYHRQATIKKRIHSTFVEGKKSEFKEITRRILKLQALKNQETWSDQDRRWVLQDATRVMAYSIGGTASEKQLAEVCEAPNLKEFFDKQREVWAVEATFHKFMDLVVRQGEAIPHDKHETSFSKFGTTTAWAEKMRFFLQAANARHYIHGEGGKDDIAFSQKRVIEDHNLHDWKVKGEKTLTTIKLNDAEERRNLTEKWYQLLANTLSHWPKDYLSALAKAVEFEGEVHSFKLLAVKVVDALTGTSLIEGRLLDNPSPLTGLNYTSRMMRLSDEVGIWSPLKVTGVCMALCKPLLTYLLLDQKQIDALHDELRRKMLCEVMCKCVPVTPEEGTCCCSRGAGMAWDQCRSGTCTDLEKELREALAHYERYRDPYLDPVAEPLEPFIAPAFIEPPTVELRTDIPEKRAIARVFVPLPKNPLPVAVPLPMVAEIISQEPKREATQPPQPPSSSPPPQSPPPAHKPSPPTLLHPPLPPPPPVSGKSVRLSLPLKLVGLLFNEVKVKKPRRVVSRAAHERHLSSFSTPIIPIFVPVSLPEPLLPPKTRLFSTRLIPPIRTEKVITVSRPTTRAVRGDLRKEPKSSFVKAFIKRENWQSEDFATERSVPPAKVKSVFLAYLWFGVTALPLLSRTRRRRRRKL